MGAEDRHVLVRLGKSRPEPCCEEVESSKEDIFDQGN